MRTISSRQRPLYVFINPDVETETPLSLYLSPNPAGLGSPNTPGQRDYVVFAHEGVPDGGRIGVSPANPSINTLDVQWQIRIHRDNIDNPPILVSNFNQLPATFSWDGTVNGAGLTMVDPGKYLYVVVGTDIVGNQIQRMVRYLEIFIAVPLTIDVVTRNMGQVFSPLSPDQRRKPNPSIDETGDFGVYDVYVSDLNHTTYQIRIYTFAPDGLTILTDTGLKPLPTSAFNEVAEGPGPHAGTFKIAVPIFHDGYRTDGLLPNESTIYVEVVGTTKEDLIVSDQDFAEVDTVGPFVVFRDSPSDPIKSTFRVRQNPDKTWPQPVIFQDHSPYSGNTEVTDHWSGSARLNGNPFPQFLSANFSDTGDDITLGSGDYVINSGAIPENGGVVDWKVSVVDAAGNIGINTCRIEFVPDKFRFAFGLGITDMPGLNLMGSSAIDIRRRSYYGGTIPPDEVNLHMQMELARILRHEPHVFWITYPAAYQNDIDKIEILMDDVLNISDDIVNDQDKLMLELDLASGLKSGILKAYRSNAIVRTDNNVYLASIDDRTGESGLGNPEPIHLGYTIIGDMIKIHHPLIDSDGESILPIGQYNGRAKVYLKSTSDFESLESYRSDLGHASPNKIPRWAGSLQVSGSPYLNLQHSLYPYAETVVLQSIRYIQEDFPGGYGQGLYQIKDMEGYLTPDDVTLIPAFWIAFTNYDRWTTGNRVSGFTIADVHISPPEAYNESNRRVISDGNPRVPSLIGSREFIRAGAASDPRAQTRAAFDVGQERSAYGDFAIHEMGYVGLTTQSTSPAFVWPQDENIQDSLTSSWIRPGFISDNPEDWTTKDGFFTIRVGTGSLGRSRIAHVDTGITYASEDFIRHYGDTYSPSTPIDAPLLERVFLNDPSRSGVHRSEVRSSTLTTPNNQTIWTEITDIRTRKNNAPVESQYKGELEQLPALTYYRLPIGLLIKNMNLTSGGFLRQQITHPFKGLIGHVTKNNQGNDLTCLSNASPQVLFQQQPKTAILPIKSFENGLWEAEFSTQELQAIRRSQPRLLSGEVKNHFKVIMRGHASFTNAITDDDIRDLKLSYNRALFMLQQMFPDFEGTGIDTDTLRSVLYPNVIVCGHWDNLSPRTSNPYPVEQQRRIDLIFVKFTTYGDTNSPATDDSLACFNSQLNIIRRNAKKNASDPLKHSTGELALPDQYYEIPILDFATASDANNDPYDDTVGYATYLNVEASGLGSGNYSLPPASRLDSSGWHLRFNGTVPTWRRGKN